MNAPFLEKMRDCCIGTAESEISFLNEAFFDNGQYVDILKAPAGSPVVLVGRKGTGKSALLRHIYTQAMRGEIKGLYVKPDDFTLLETLGDAQDVATIKRLAYNSIINTIAIAVGSSLKGMLGKKDKKLFDRAVQEGVKDNDGIQQLLKGLSQFGTALTDIKFSALVPGMEKTETGALEVALTSHFGKPGRLFYFLLDDVDQIATVTQTNYANRIWGFILAVKKLTECLPNLKCIITLRTEVWYLLQNDDKGQRDQIDHIRPLIRELDPEEAIIRKIVEKRIALVNKLCGYERIGADMSKMFEGIDVELPGSTERRFWMDFIVNSARNRPRDSIQFLGTLSKAALAKKQKIITSKIASDAMSIFSESRVDDLGREYAKECTTIKEIIRSFHRIDYRGVEAEEMREHLSKIPTMFGVSIRDKSIQAGSSEGLFILWKFLHEIGFLTPCIPDQTRSREFTHISFKRRPDLVSIANWNDMQKVLWEIHPAYRSYLQIVRNEENARSGLSLSNLISRKKRH